MTGFSLPELLMALALFGIIAAIVYPVISGQRRIYGSAAEHIDTRQNLRAAVHILATDFRELDASDGDIAVMSPTAITLRGTRQLALLCAIPTSGITAVLPVRQAPVFGLRDFNVATDSLLIYYQDGDRDAWLPARLVATGTSVCADGSSARTLTARLSSDTVRLEVGAPIRGFEAITYRLYQAGDGRWQIGMEDGGPGSVQPLVGPVTSRGLSLTYRDARGVITAVRESVATIELRIRMDSDSAVEVIALRNNRRS